MAYILPPRAPAAQQLRAITEVAAAAQVDLANQITTVERAISALRSQCLEPSPAPPLPPDALLYGAVLDRRPCPLRISPAFTREWLTNRAKPATVPLPTALPEDPAPAPTPTDECPRQTIQMVRQDMQEEPIRAPRTAWRVYPPMGDCVRLHRQNILNNRKALPYETAVVPEQCAMVCITVGPETRWESLEASMLGVLKNSTAFADHYGEFMLQQLVLVVVLDGKKAVKPEVFAGLSRAGFLSTDVLEPVSLEPILHCFYTRAIYTHAHHQYGPCQVLVVVKEEQAGRLDSHSIFLAGLCMRIYPEYVFLIEAGVIPNPRALLEMYTALQRDELLGGCCGEVELIPSFCNPVIMAQMFVAKMGHALSLAGFSLLGFMPSLSPAFSAYRFAALVDAGADTDEAPLQRYLAGLKRMERSAFAAFLLSADERILCVEICARTDSRFRLRYVSRAVGTAEAAHDVPSLLGHRKLAVNGSLAGLAYALLHLRRLGCGGGGLVRHLAGVTYVACLLTAVLVHFFAAGILYALYEVFIIEPLGTDSWQFGIANGLGQAFSLILQYTLLFSLLLQIVFGIGNSHATGLKDFYDGSVLYFVLLQSALGLFLGVYFLGSANHFLQLTAAIAVAVVHVAVLLHRPADLLHFAAAAPAFLQLLPLFAIVIPCRSFANLCDSSGGSRIVPASQWDSSGAQTLRSVFMLVWVTANIAMAVALTQLCTVMANGKDVFLMALALSAAVCGAILTGCLVAMKIADCFGRLSVVKATATAEAPPTGSGPPGRPASSPSLPSLRRTNTPGGTFRSKLRIPANDGDEDGNYDSEESLPPLPNSEGTATTPGSSTHSPPTAPGPRADAAPPPPTDDYPPSDANV